MDGFFDADASLGCMERCANVLPGRAASCAYVCGAAAQHPAAGLGAVRMRDGPGASPFQPSVCQSLGGAPRPLWYGWDTPAPVWHSAYAYRPNNGPCALVPGGGIVCRPPRTSVEHHHYVHRRRHRNGTKTKEDDGTAHKQKDEARGP